MIPNLSAEERLWFHRGFYLAAMMTAGQNLLAEVDPAPEQLAALAVAFFRELGIHAPGCDGVPEEESPATGTWTAWRAARRARVVTELRQLIAEADARVVRVEPAPPR